MSSGLFDDPRQRQKAYAAQMVVPESEIRKGLQHSNSPILAAKFINISVDRFKKYAQRYVDAETGLDLLELQQRARLIEKANKVGTAKKKKKKKHPSDSEKSYMLSVDLTEEQIRDAMEATDTNAQAAALLDVSKKTYRKYAQRFVDEKTGMTLYELQYEKWKKINFERFEAKRKTGWFEKLEARKKAFENARFKPGHQIKDEHKFKGLQLTEETVRTAIQHTRSNRQAADWLRISYSTWKKYAEMYKDPVTGRTLFSCHMATGGKGVPKAGHHRNKGKATPKALELGYQLIKGQFPTPQRIDELAARLMKDGRLGFCCSECGFAQKRPIDMKMPLLLNFFNGDRTDWREENLRWLCYNCSFLTSTDYFTRTKRQILQATAPESPDAPQDLESFYKMDEFYLEHLRRLSAKNMAEEVKQEHERPKEGNELPTKDMTHPSLEDLIDFK
jgi:hypothetical protein